MGFLAGKHVLITGLLSNRSIAYGVAKAARREGAELAFTYQNERFKDRVTEMAGEFGSTLVFPCDVASDAEIATLFSELGKKWNALDGLVHAIAFAPREAITGDFLEGLSREAFRIAHDVSSYSLAALAKAALPLMQGRPAALVTLTYLGADRVVPGYNTMGLAKASLEAGVRYLAASLGPKGIRVNAVSAGPIKTLAASGIAGFSKILKYVEENSPMRRNVTTGDVGNVAAFLLSDLAAGVTGEITYVDGGFNTVVGALPLLSKNASLLTLTYLGAVRVVPNYNTMGLAKASLEAAVRYLAASLGPRGIRVNGISAGPIKTLAAAGIGGFGKILKFVEAHAPLRRNVTTEDVGNAAAFLLSDLAAAVTGEILYVDAGFSHVMAGSLSTSSPDSTD